MRIIALFIISMFFVKPAISNATLENAQHRLPPVMYSLDIPHSMTATDSYLFKWSIMGYHDEYKMIIRITDENNNELFKKTVVANSQKTGEYQYGSIQSKEFLYEADVKLNQTLGWNQDLQIRFYASPTLDLYDTTFLSTIIPAGLGYRAKGTSGRIIKVSGITSLPSIVKDVFLDKSGGTSYLLNPGGAEHGWRITTGSPAHKGVDEFSDDWNWGVNDSGKGFYSGISGLVIFTGVMFDPYNDSERFNDASEGWFGNQVIIYNEESKTAVRYAHLKEVLLSEGEQVVVGQEIGEVGKTGRLPEGVTSMGDHLHMTLYKNIDSAAYELLAKGWWPHSRTTTGGDFSNYRSAFGYIGDTRN